VQSMYGQAGGTSGLYTDAYLTSQSAVQSGDYTTQLNADMNIAYAEHYAAAARFSLKWENTAPGTSIGDVGATFSDGAKASSASRALFYCGFAKNPRYNDIWEWLPGSAAFQLSSGGTFGLDALHHGATAAAYAVNEPSLAFYPRPNVVIYYLLHGFNFAEASTLATPTINWMTINEGDPLYNPTGAKLAAADTFAPILSAGYPNVTPGVQPTDKTINILVEDAPEPEAWIAGQHVVPLPLDTQGSRRQRYNHRRLHLRHRDHFGKFGRGKYWWR
jgi:hypothetical protein